MNSQEPTTLRNNNMRMAAWLLPLLLGVEGCKSVLQIYDGPARPASEVACVAPANLIVHEMDGKKDFPARMGVPFFDVLPGTHDAFVQYNNPAAYSTSIVHVRFSVDAGYFYLLEGRTKQFTRDNKWCVTLFRCSHNPYNAELDKPSILDTRIGIEFALSGGHNILNALRGRNSEECPRCHTAMLVEIFDGWADVVKRVSCPKCNWGFDVEMLAQ